MLEDAAGTRRKRNFSSVYETRDDEPMWIDEDSVTEPESESKRRKQATTLAEQLPAAPSVRGLGVEHHPHHKSATFTATKRSFSDVASSGGPDLPFDCAQPQKRPKLEPLAASNDPEDEETTVQSAFPPQKQYLLRVRPDLRMLLFTFAFLCYAVRSCLFNHQLFVSVSCAKNRGVTW